MSDVIKIKKTIPQENLKLKVYFSNGEIGVCDVSQLLDNPNLAELKDPVLFNHVAVDDYGGVFWLNGFDISPDYLYSVANWEN